MTTVLSALSEQNFGNNTRQVEAALKKHEAIAADIEARVYSLINCVTIQLTDLVSFTVDDQEVMGLTTSQSTPCHAECGKVVHTHVHLCF